MRESPGGHWCSWKWALLLTNARPHASQLHTTRLPIRDCRRRRLKQLNKAVWNKYQLISVSAFIRYLRTSSLIKHISHSWHFLLFTVGEKKRKYTQVRVWGKKLSKKFSNFFRFKSKIQDNYYTSRMIKDSVRFIHTFTN